ncbi:MAG: preprotein translocase subunit SecE [Verrucomicrobiae bacterium]|nr:preprotein translocase subunit SecE [Verrucomicrobiae bacterium]
MKSWFDNIRRFFREVREEVLKCTRPTREELQESTVVIVVTMAALGGFIFACDMLIGRGFSLIIAR